MRTSRRQYIDHNNEELFYRLDWHFDENIDFCSQLDVLPSAVTFVGKEETSEWVETKELGLTKENIVVVHFIEFYGLKHKLMKIVFGSRDRSDKYMVDEDDSAREIDNAESMFNCKNHPAAVPHNLTDCQQDYEFADIDGIKLDDLLYSKSEPETQSGWVGQHPFLFAF